MSHTDATAEYIMVAYGKMLDAIQRDGVSDPEYDEHMILDFLVLVMKSPRLSENQKRPIMHALLYAWDDAGSVIDLEEEPDREAKSYPDYDV